MVMAVESENDGTETCLLVINDRPELLLSQPHFICLSSTVNTNAKLLSREGEASLVNFVYFNRPAILLPVT